MSAVAGEIASVVVIHLGDSAFSQSDDGAALCLGVAAKAGTSGQIIVGRRTLIKGHGQALLAIVHGMAIRTVTGHLCLDSSAEEEACIGDKESNLEKVCLPFSETALPLHCLLPGAVRLRVEFLCLNRNTHATG